MSLTPIQVAFIKTKLGVQPNRGMTEILSKITDYRIESALSDYAEQENTMILQLPALRNVVGYDAGAVERRVQQARDKVDNATRNNAAGDINDAADDLKTLNKAAENAITNAKFYADLDNAEKALAVLTAGAQRNHIKGEIKTATESLGAARRLAGQGKYNDAKSSLTMGVTAVTQGEIFAGEYSLFIPIKANALRILGARKDVLKKEDWEIANGTATNAAAKAEPPVRNYTAAKLELQQVITDMKAQMTAEYVTKPLYYLDKVKLNHTTLRANANGGATVIDDDVQTLNAARQRMKDNIDTGKWGTVPLDHRVAIRLSISTFKVSERRLAYDAIRIPTKISIDALAGPTKIRNLAADCNTRLAAADDLAATAKMKFEDGIKALRDIDGIAKALLITGTAAQDYLRERVDAEDKLVPLRDTAAAKAGILDTQLSFIDGLLQSAITASGVADAKTQVGTGLDMADVATHRRDWAGARKSVKQAVDAMTLAEQLGTDMGDTLAAQSQAKAADDLPKMQKAIADLRALAKDGETNDDTGAAVHEWINITDSLDVAEENAKQGLFDMAQVTLNGAANLLVAAQLALAETKRLAAEWLVVSGKLTILLALTDPPAATIKPKTDPIADQLKLAQQQIDSRGWDKAAALLAAAKAAAEDAGALADARKLYDAKALQLTNEAVSLDPTPKSAVTQMIAQAKSKADSFNFTQADAILDTAEAQIAGAVVAAKAIAGVLDGAFDTALAKMLKAAGVEDVDPSSGKKTRDKTIPNGGELLDRLVAQLPGSVPVSVMAKLIKERFGIDLTVSVLTRAGTATTDVIPVDHDDMEDVDLRSHSDRTKSAKRIYEMLALTPDDSKNNPSLNKIVRQKAKETGGDYSPLNNVNINGRPGASTQKFGAKQLSYKFDAQGQVVRGGDGKPVMVPELPPRESDIYDVTNDADVDYFDFVNVHETGHAVDDRLRFMTSRLRQPGFGGWDVHSSNLQPIVSQVLAKFGRGQDAVLGDYVADLIGGAKPIRPVVAPKDQITVNTACDEIDTWHKVVTGKSLWWDDANSTLYAMPDGRVYQESYDKAWVSYPLAERTRGVTGYQFRAPGEWFAELYAAYHLKKLKPSHPAVAWLSTLSS